MRREKKGALLSRLEGLLEVVGFELTTDTSRPVAYTLRELEGQTCRF